MAGRWFRFDADYFDHPKAVSVGLAARGLYIASIAYCFRHETDGWLPARVVRRLVDDENLDPGALAAELVDARLWDADGRDYRVHDYLDYQPSGEQRKAEREAAAERQRRSRAARRDAADKPPGKGSKRRPSRHAPVTGDVTRDKGVSHGVSHNGVARNGARDATNNGVSHADEAPVEPPETTLDADEEAANPQVNDGADCHASVTGDVTRDMPVSHAYDVTRQDMSKTSGFLDVGEGSGENPSPPDGDPPDPVGPQAADDDEEVVAEVIDLTDREARRLCELLADQIQAWSGERPPIGKKWHSAARLLLTKDGPDGKGYTAEQVEYLIRWATADEFWRPNIQSMPTLRRQRLTLIGQIQRERTRGHRHTDIDAARAASVAELDDDGDDLAGGALR